MCVTERVKFTLRAKEARRTPETGSLNEVSTCAAGIQDAHTHEIVNCAAWITETPLMAFFHPDDIRLVLRRVLWLKGFSVGAVLEEPRGVAGVLVLGVEQIQQVRGGFRAGGFAASGACFADGQFGVPVNGRTS